MNNDDCIHPLNQASIVECIIKMFKTVIFQNNIFERYIISINKQLDEERDYLQSMILKQRQKENDEKLKQIMADSMIDKEIREMPKTVTVI